MALSNIVSKTYLAGSGLFVDPQATLVSDGVATWFLVGITQGIWVTN